jgi:hypothetical protein
MVVVAQLVRALVCGTRGRRFEPGLPPLFKSSEKSEDFFYAHKLTTYSLAESNKDKKPPVGGLNFNFTKIVYFKSNKLSTAG